MLEFILLLGEGMADVCAAEREGGSMEKETLKSTWVFSCFIKLPPAATVPRPCPKIIAALTKASAAWLWKGY